MVDCCKHSKNIKNVLENQIKNHLIFHENLLKKCKNPKGFSKKSSCAPYNDCFKGGKNYLMVKIF